MELTERVTGSRSIYDGKIVSLRIDTVQLPNGHSSQREIVSHRGAVCIVPLRSDGVVLFVRQFRLSAGRELLEIPAGMLEPDEDPKACAARELEEETGCRAGALHKLFHAFLSPGYSTETIHAYLATDLSQGVAHTDTDENVAVVEIPVDQIEARIASGEIEDAKTIAALLMATRVHGPST